MYYGAPDNQVHELAPFPNVNSQYFPQHVFNGTNGNAGIGSMLWDGSGLGHLYIFDENDKLQHWSNNFTTTHDVSQNALYGSWIEGRLSPSPLKVLAH